MNLLKQILKKKTVVIEHDQPFERSWLIVAEFAFKCCEKGMNWEATRAEVLKRIHRVIKMKFKIIISIDGVEKDFWTSGALELVHMAIERHEAFKAPTIAAIRDKSVVSIKLHQWKKTGEMQ